MRAIIALLVAAALATGLAGCLEDEEPAGPGDGNGEDQNGDTNGDGVVDANDTTNTTNTTNSTNTTLA